MNVVNARLQSLDVLILILMEHAQREHWPMCIWNVPNKVLILILMEHAQRVGVSKKENRDGKKSVLILILMEHAQREHFL